MTKGNNSTTSNPQLYSKSVTSISSKSSTCPKLLPVTNSFSSSSSTSFAEWSEVVEEAYRFQLAGYRNQAEYLEIHGSMEEQVSRWPHNGYVKKLRKKNTPYFYYYDKTRECPDKEVQKIKVWE
eukprot:Sdes_comp16367_c0_seq1m5721